MFPPWARGQAGGTADSLPRQDEGTRLVSTLAMTVSSADGQFRQGRTQGNDRQARHVPFAHLLPTTQDRSGRIVPDTGTVSDVMTGKDRRSKALESTGFDVAGQTETGTVANSGGGTRTPDTRIMIPLL